MIVEIDIFAWILRLTGLAALWLIIRFLRGKIRVSPKGKAVLVTGCDSGFGLMTAERLAKGGFLVFAGCLTDKGVEYFNEKANIIAIKMDVTNEESVKDAYEEVKKNLQGSNCQGLWGVINNAGLLRSGELEVMSIHNWQIQMNVNVMGMVITSKVFFPLLMKSKGRIVNIASVAGRFATPNTSGYNASKYAVEGLSDSWRRELKMWGIKVIIIEPGIMKTPLWDAPLNEASIDLVWNLLNDEQKERFGREFFIENEKTGRELVRKFGGDPKQVVDVLEESIAAKWPQSRYAVGLDALIWVGLSYFPSCISDAILPVIMKQSVPKSLKK